MAVERWVGSVRMRHLKAIIVIACLTALVLVGPSPAEALGARGKALRSTMFKLVNSSRRHHSVRVLNLNKDVSRAAWRHSRRMARRRTVFHTTDLYSRLSRYRPVLWGENVGMAGTLRRMERLFMRSAPHRANILNPRFHRIGVGVVRAHGRLWVTMDFYG